MGKQNAHYVCLASVISSILMVHGLNSTIEARFVIAFSISLAIPLSLVGLSLTKVCRNLAIQLVHKMDEKENYWIGKEDSHNRFKSFLFKSFLCTFLE